MKTFLLCALVALSSSVVSAQPRPLNPTLRGFVSFRERILPPPDATVHVALTTQIPGETALPLSSMVVPIQSARTPFELSIPANFTARTPLQLNAWIVQNGRVWMRNLEPTRVVDFRQNAEVRVGIVRVAGENNMKIITGEVFKLDRRALAPNTRVEVELRDVSRMGAPAPLLAKQTLTLAGNQLPIDFRLEVAGEKLQARNSYALSARVYEGEKLSYLNDTRFAVDGQKAEQTIRIRVVPLPR